MRVQVKREPKPAFVQENRPAAAESAKIPNSEMLRMLEFSPSSRVDLSAALQARMEARFGVSLAGLHVYEDSNIREAGKLGYARGNEVHISDDLSGARREEALSHEIGHVVQQGSGMVRGTGFVADQGLESQASRGFTPAPGVFSMPAAADGAPVQGLDDYDAAAEKKGFWGGLGRRAASPFRFIWDKLKILKHKTVGFKESDTAKKLAAEKTADPGQIGDAVKYSGVSAGIGPGKASGTETDPDNASGVNDKVNSFTDVVAPALTAVLPIVKHAAVEPLNHAAGVVNTVSQFGLGLSDAVPKLAPALEYLSGNFGDLSNVAQGTMGSMQDLAPGAFLGAAGAGMSLLANVADAGASTIQAFKSGKAGNVAGGSTSGLQAASSAAIAARSAAEIAGFAGVAAGPIVGAVIPGLYMAAGAAKAAKGAIGLTSGKRTQSKMTGQIDELKAGNKETAGFSEEQKLRMLRTMHMAREMGAINKEAGILDTVSGATTAAGGAMSLSGIGAGLGGITSLGGITLGVLGDFNKGVQTLDMRERVVEQEIGLKQRVAAFSKELRDRGVNEKLDNETKERIVLKRMGYESGTKLEVFMNIAMNRSKYLTDTANKDKDPALIRKGEQKGADGKKLHGEDKYDWTDKEEGLKSGYRERRFARRMLKNMGLSKVDIGGKKGYTQQGAAEKLGMDVGIDADYQLRSYQGESIDQKIAAQREKSKNAWFGFRKRKYDAKIAELEERKKGLVNNGKVSNGN